MGSAQSVGHRDGFLYLSGQPRETTFSSTFLPVALNYIAGGRAILSSRTKGHAAESQRGLVENDDKIQRGRAAHPVRYVSSGAREARRRERELKIR